MSNGVTIAISLDPHERIARIKKIMSEMRRLMNFGVILNSIKVKIILKEKKAASPSNCP